MTETSSGNDEVGVQVEKVLRMEGDFLCGGGALLALHGLMSKRYWERLWIIQDVVKGASATGWRRRHEWLDWQTFVTAWHLWKRSFGW